MKKPEPQIGRASEMTSIVSFGSAEKTRSIRLTMAGSRASTQRILYGARDARGEDVGQMWETWGALSALWRDNARTAA